MRHAGWYIVGVLLLGALFWPYLLLFAFFVLIVAVVGAITKR